MSSNINGSLSQFNGFGNSSFKTTPVFNRKKETAVTSKTNEKTADTVPVDLKNKPKGTNTGEYLLRESLNQISSKYGFNSSDVELEIVTRQQNNSGFSKNHDNYTDEQLAKDIKSGNTKIDFSINQSTIDKMKERKAVLEIVAQKEAFGGNLSEKDRSELLQLGYNDQDISNLRNVKMMEYGGHKANFEKQVEDNAKQKVYADTKADLKGTLFEDNAKLNADGNEEAFNLLMDNETKRRVDDKLRYGQKPALQYLAEQDFEKQRIAEQGKLNERLKAYSVTDYAETFTKNFANSFYGGIGDATKGLAVANQGNTIYPNGEQPKVSDTLGYKIGDWIKENVQAPNVNQDIDKTFLGGTLPKTIGGLLPAVLGAWATKNPQATVAVYSGLSTGGAVYDEAKAKGATEKQAQQTALLTGGFIGITSTMGYGKTLEALNSGVGSKAWQQIFKEAVKDGGRNAIIAGGQTIGENAIAKTIYDKNRGYLDNIEQRMITAGITGTALKGGIEIIGKVKAGTNPQTLAKTQRIFNISKEKINAKVGEFQNTASLAKAKLQNKTSEIIQKVKVTDAEAIQAKKVIREYAKNQPLYSSIYLGTVEPKLANAYRKVGQKAIQDGYTNFKEFSGEMVKTVGAKVKPHLAKLFSEVSNEGVFKASKSEIEVFKTKENELKAKFESIEEFRKTNKLPEFSYPKNAKGEVTGTVAYLEADGKKVFGTNTTIGREKLGTDNVELRKEAITNVQNKLGKLRGAKYNDKDTKFLTHAEAEALLKLAKNNGGKLPEELTMYVDRPTCTECRGKVTDVGKGLSLLTELYGVKKLTIQDSYGTKYIVRPNQTTEIIK